MNVVEAKWHRIFMILIFLAIIFIILQKILQRKIPREEISERHSGDEKDITYLFDFPEELLESIEHTHKGIKIQPSTSQLNQDLKTRHRKSSSNFTSIILRHDALREENELMDNLKMDKGAGCKFPNTDPFADEIIVHAKQNPSLNCKGETWVKCYLSQCAVLPEVFDKLTNVTCSYRDIIYVNDNYYYLDHPVTVEGNGVYILMKSDHVKINCTGINKTSNHKTEADDIRINGERATTTANKSKGKQEWTGHSLGFRLSVERQTPPPGREDSPNVLIFGFNSVSRNEMIRHMPRTYDFLENQFDGTILKGYSIVGDGAKATLFPILTGNTELELPDIRTLKHNKRKLDTKYLIFSKLKKDGYRTAYFEDMPWAGTFQFTQNGLNRQPSDHYLRPFLQEELKYSKRSHMYPKTKYYCIKDTPQYRVMMDITEQFFNLDGKKFAFSFISDISHDEFGLLSVADNVTVEFLTRLKNDGHLDNTLLLVMGDHGYRFHRIRNTLQGRLEERQPFMFIGIPDKMKSVRPEAQAHLEANREVLATPHDIHATILDAIGLTKHYNEYRIPGADFKRGLSLFGHIPKNRSCSEAGIRASWCVCFPWNYLSPDDGLHARAAGFVVQYINLLTEAVRDFCELRTIYSIEWVKQQLINGKASKNYVVKIVTEPAGGLFEAPITYDEIEDKFETDIRDISRTNLYGSESKCIKNKYPHLYKFCYCKNKNTKPKT